MTKSSSMSIMLLIITEVFANNIGKTYRKGWLRLKVPQDKVGDVKSKARILIRQYQAHISSFCELQDAIMELGDSAAICTLADQLRTEMDVIINIAMELSRYGYCNSNDIWKSYTSKLEDDLI